LGKGKGKMKGKDPSGPKAKGKGNVPKSKSRHLEHSTADHRAFNDAIKKGWPLERAKKAAKVAAHRHASNLFWVTPSGMGAHML
jgi:hypothetical protein